MFKESLKVIGFLSLFIAAGNIIALCQRFTETFPGYLMLLTIVSFLIVLWYNVIKLMNINN